jgi:putative ubiquitin-RnfH superfamily antitoxin RatB of RatAB toxin-antitoxin module
MKVEVVMAWPRRYEAVSVELVRGATVGDAIAAAGWTGREGVSGYAVFGVNADATTLLLEGDRVELLRPLQIDPMEARRRRASRPGC